MILKADSASCLAECIYMPMQLCSFLCISMLLPKENYGCGVQNTFFLGGRVTGQWLGLLVLALAA